jgi:hypothetical protein
MKGRGWWYTEPRYVASYLMGRYGFMGLREIGDQVGLHFNAGANPFSGVANHARGSMAQLLRELEYRFKNQESLLADPAPLQDLRLSPIAALAGRLSRPYPDRILY